MCVAKIVKRLDECWVRYKFSTKGRKNGDAMFRVFALSFWIYLRTPQMYILHGVGVAKSRRHPQARVCSFQTTSKYRFARKYGASHLRISLNPTVGGVRQSIHVAQRQEACAFCRPTTVLPQFETVTRLVNENAHRFGLAVCSRLSLISVQFDIGPRVIT